MHAHAYTHTHTHTHIHTPSPQLPPTTKATSQRPVTISGSLEELFEADGVAVLLGYAGTHHVG